MGCRLLALPGALGAAVVLASSGCAAHENPLRALTAWPADVPDQRPSTEAGCDRFASPAGSNANAGSRRRPVRTVRHLAGLLERDQTGCLLPGLYPSTALARLVAPGSGLRGIGTARVRGPIWITPRATGARVSHLVLTSRKRGYPEPLKVQADRAVVTRNRIFGSTNTNCVLVGSQRVATGVRIVRNVISRCGRRSKFTHLLYLSHTREAQVRDNVLTDNPGGWAVHLYPDADRTLVEGNVIERNRGGVIFAGADGETSDDNLVRNNVISGSGPRWNVEGSWSGDDPGTGNLAISNCTFSRGPGAPTGIAPADGFAVIGVNVAQGAGCLPAIRRETRSAGL